MLCHSLLSPVFIFLMCIPSKVLFFDKFSDDSSLFSRKTVLTSFTLFDRLGCRIAFVELVRETGVVIVSMLKQLEFEVICVW